MRIEVLTEPDVDAATDEAICRLQYRAFPMIERFERERHWIHDARPGDIRVLAFEDDQLIGQTVVYWASTDRGRVGGLGNVCSDPDHRGQGYVAACIRHAIGEGRDRSVDWLLLFSREENVSFYAKFGFERVDHDVWVTRTDGTIYAYDRDSVCMVMTLSDRPWPSGKLVLDIEKF